MAAIIGTGMLARSIDYNNTIPKHLAWALHAGVMGAVLAPLVFVGGPVLFRAAWYTAGLVGGKLKWGHVKFLGPVWRKEREESFLPP